MVLSVGRFRLWVMGVGVVALAVGGVKGVVHMLTLLQTELEMTMALCGCATIDAIDRDVIYSERM